MNGAAPATGPASAGSAIALIVAALWLTAAPFAQTATEPSFDVASVKPTLSGEDQSAAFTQPGGHYTATNVTVRALVKSAYGLHDDQIVGGPGWMNTDRF